MILFTDMEVVGFIPTFLSADDPRPAKEQIHEGYAVGGGWRPFQGFTLHEDSNSEYFLFYPGDPEFHELSRAWLRDELILYFDCSWVAIVQPDGSWEIARLD